MKYAYGHIGWSKTRAETAQFWSDIPPQQQAKPTTGLTSHRYSASLPLFPAPLKQLALLLYSAGSEVTYPARF